MKKILVSGSTGFIGKNFINFITRESFSVTKLVRKNNHVDDSSIFWNPYEDVLNIDKFEDFDVIIHLSGRSPITRITQNVKQALYSSRVETTKNLVNMITKLKKPPDVFLCASATGYYGDQGNTDLYESSNAGNGFWSDMCSDWETATIPVKELGIRTVNLRIGNVIDKVMDLILLKLPIFSDFGHGNQYYPFISMHELNNILLHVIQNDNINGPVNLVSPQPITNHMFNQALSKVYHRPAILSIPEILPRLFLGREIANLLYGSSKVFPKKLLDSGYKFAENTPEESIIHYKNYRVK